MPLLPRQCQAKDRMRNSPYCPQETSARIAMTAESTITMPGTNDISQLITTRIVSDQLDQSSDIQLSLSAIPVPQMFVTCSLICRAMIHLWIRFIHGYSFAIAYGSYGVHHAIKAQSRYLNDTIWPTTHPILSATISFAMLILGLMWLL